MDNFSGFFLILMVVLNLHFRFRALNRGLKEVAKAESKKWEIMDEAQRKRKARSDWQDAWQAYFGAIMSAELIVFITAIALLVKPHSAFVSILLPWFTIPPVLFVALVPWLAMRWNSTARRAKQYHVYGGHGMIGTIDSMILMVLFGCSFLLFPILRHDWLSAIYITTALIHIAKTWQKSRQLLAVDKAEKLSVEI